MTAPLSPELARVAAAYGVATSYENWAHERTEVDPAAVVAVLDALGVDVGDPAAALAAADLRPWRRLLPPTVVSRAGSGAEVVVRGRATATPLLRLAFEDGSTGDVVTAVAGASRVVDGVERVATTFTLPDELPLGWHRIDVVAGDEQAAAVLIVAPPRIDPPAALGTGRAWGWMVQLYSVLTGDSWGMGDYGDLRTLVEWSGGDGAGVLLCNPLHAPSPVEPIQPSPYYPSSRRFRSPLYLRVADTVEYSRADDTTRAQIDARAPALGALIDRDSVWRAKIASLEQLFPLAQAPDRRAALQQFQAAQGAGLRDFATFCALAERHGLPWQDWPEELRSPASPAVEAARVELADRVELHTWLQLLCDEQLAQVSAAAAATGMPVGVVHDLAVGVDPGGADAWGVQDALAHGARVGAPPDSFNQQGQDWGLPPWHPDRLADLGYAPFRDMIRSVLRHAGGIRIDHVMGLFRLWWVPEGKPADHGTYVRYDANAMLAVLALEAERAGALVVGEDLGTVEKAVSRALADNGVLGSAVLWFEKDDDGEHLPPAAWRELTMASVSTHDLPTATGFLTDEPVRVRAELDQLGHSVEEEEQRVQADRDALLGLLRSEGLIGATPTEEDVVLAMHEVLVRTPCRLVLASLTDAAGDLRQPNLPGTTDEYPNWRMPVADRQGRSLTLDEIRRLPLVRRVVERLQTVAAST